MSEINYPMHIMVPAGSTLLLQKMLQRQNNEFAVQLEKMDSSTGGEYSTTYRVVGGTLKAILNVLEQCGFEPPLGKTATRAGPPWHISI